MTTLEELEKRVEELEEKLDTHRENDYDSHSTILELVKGLEDKWDDPTAIMERAAQFYVQGLPPEMRGAGGPEPAASQTTAGTVPSDASRVASPMQQRDSRPASAPECYNHHLENCPDAGCPWSVTCDGGNHPEPVPAQAALPAQQPRSCDNCGWHEGIGICHSPDRERCTVPTFPYWQPRTGEGVR